MRITDVRTGRLTGIRPAHPGLLRVRVHLTSAGAPYGLGDLRTLLVADVLFRLAEFNGLQVIVCRSDAGHPEDEVKALARDADRLGIHPPADHAAPGPAAPSDVHVVAHTAAADAITDGLVVVCGPAEGAEGFLDAPGNEPLAVRLALLDRAYAEPARLDAETLDGAQAQLRRWRQLVAAWADTPSRPSHPEVVRSAFAALGEELDASAALAGLRRLESEPGVPDGSRFETYLCLDRILGLELPREIGRARP